MKIYRQIYSGLIQKLCAESEISESDLLSSRDERCFLARIAVVCGLSDKGLTDMEISRVMGLSQQVVNRNKSIGRYRFSHSRTLRIMSYIVKDYLDEKFAGTEPTFE